MNCPFTNSHDGFTCTSSPAQQQLQRASKIPSSGTYRVKLSRVHICPSVDYNSHALYNGCWTSELVNDATPQVFCSGSSTHALSERAPPRSCQQVYVHTGSTVVLGASLRP